MARAAKKQGRAKASKTVKKSRAKSDKAKAKAKPKPKPKSRPKSEPEAKPEAKSKSRTKVKVEKAKSIDILSEPATEVVLVVPIEPAPVVKKRNPFGGGRKKSFKDDKIFNNDYNSGSIDMESFTTIRVSGDYEDNLDDTYKSDEYMSRKIMSERAMELFKQSQWGGLPLTKKFPKELLTYIFHDIYKGLMEPGTSVVDVVIVVADFMDISYERAYEIAGLRIKELLINELESKYGRLSKNRISRLF